MTFFPKENDYDFSNGVEIPQTVTQFSTNSIFHFNDFHANLTHVVVTVQSMIYLTNLANKTPNLVHLSVTFARIYYNVFKNETDAFYKDQIKILNYRLTKLRFLSIQTKETKVNKMNTHLPFDEIDLFIHQHCPDATILKHLILQLHQINFSKERWSTIMRYKANYSRFDFYGSFIVDNTKILLNTDQFDYYIEGMHPSHPNGRFVYVYSLPFVFDKLYGYSSCSELPSETSFSTVRHLYFTRELHIQPVSFESLAKRMPKLLSIHYHCTFRRNYGTMTVSTIKPVEEIFNHMSSLHFEPQCHDEYCICEWLLFPLMDRDATLTEFNYIILSSYCRYKTCTND